MKREIGLDTHRDICTVSVLSETGPQVQRQVVDTASRALVKFRLGISPRCLAEGKFRGVRRLVVTMLSVSILLAAACGGRVPSATDPGPQQVGVFAVRNAEGWGFVDRKGSVLLEPQFDCVGAFYQGKALVALDGRWGYVGTRGEVIASPQFDWGGFYNDGFAPVRLGESYFLLGEDGRLVAGSVFEGLGEFAEGLAAAKSEGLWGYVNSSAEWVIEPSFVRAARFRNGRAAVTISNGEEVKWTMVNRRGRILAPAQWDWVSAVQHERAVVRLSERSGLIDDQGGYIVNPEYDSIDILEDGLAAVRKDGQAGLIDGSGELIVPLRFQGVGFQGSEQLWPCSGRAVDPRETFREVSSDRGDLFLARSNGYFGAIDQDGEFVVPAKFESLEPFVGGLGLASLNRAFGFVDRSGEWVIENRFSEASHFSEGRAKVKSGEKWGFIGVRGEWAIEPQFDEALSFFDGASQVRIGNQFGIIDGEGIYIYGPTTMYAQAPSEVEQALNREFGAGSWSYAEIPSDDARFFFDRSFKPFYLVGDFDCDAKQDHAVRIDLEDRQGSIVVLMSSLDYSRGIRLQGGAFLGLIRNERSACDSLWTGKFESHGQTWTWDYSRKSFRKL